MTATVRTPSRDTLLRNARKLGEPSTGMFASLERCSGCLGARRTMCFDFQYRWERLNVRVICFLLAGGATLRKSHGISVDLRPDCTLYCSVYQPGFFSMVSPLYSWKSYVQVLFALHYRGSFAHDKHHCEKDEELLSGADSIRPGRLYNEAVGKGLARFWNGCANLLT